MMRPPFQKAPECKIKCQGYPRDFCCGEFCERLAAQPAKPTESQIDAALMARIPGGSNARDWFLPHENPRALKNVRDVVKLMLEAAYKLRRL